MYAGLLLAVLLISINVDWCVSVDVLDVVFGPRLRSIARRSDTTGDNNSTLSRAEKLAHGFGYPFESHDVTSEDGYILGLHRIPFSRKKTFKQSRPVVLFHHGLFASSDSFLFRGPDSDISYILADAGYDVWLVNTRGNIYSRRHTVLNPDTDRKFWMFSFHEAAIFDLSAIIDYVLRTTSRKDLYYIGYSLGATVGYVLCSERPQYNSKIRLMAGLAPAAYIVHRANPVMSLIFTALPPLLETLNSENITELFPYRPMTEDMLTTLCRNESPTQQICLAAIFIFVGIDYRQFNTTIIPQMFKFFPAGTSLCTLKHIYEMFTTGHFKPIDYGPEINRIKYKVDAPKEYDLSKVTAPASLHYGDGDFLVTQEDSEFLAGKLQNVAGVFKVPYRNFNHLDFMWGSDTKKLVYDPLIILMNKYR